MTEAERDVLISYWRAQRFPQESARLRGLELDFEFIGNTSRILESYQRQTHNPSVVAAGTFQTNPRGAPGPMPTNRGLAMTLEQRGHATQAAVNAALAGR